ncbi:hypothetical protein GP2143_03188 [marine gamma proteobacterium HTCC2143]|uniref:Uncharacterized protein n=1 Tax=marine gamma proteobacterium HTCC2143 TaxID=247633 RepID=A0YCY9_9GAMM|nr:hypothetical protein GP2143_03188 [marine gamma proteobacterium HTCC2143]
MPMNVHSGCKGSFTNAAAWGSLADVVCGMFLDGYTGFAYVFTIDDGIVGTERIDDLTLDGLRWSFKMLTENRVAVPVGVVAQIMGHRLSASAVNTILIVR